MKIGDRHSIRDPRLGGGPGGLEPEGAPVVRPDEARGDDQVSVSKVARALAQLLAVRGGERPDPGRAEKIASLRAAVAGGTYQPDLQQVARSLLTEVLGPVVA
jgi:flagellar biosynthesis anti-sigma factor FlgM